jgi:hypothetical protein
MAWGYWSATAVDRGRSPRRLQQQLQTSSQIQCSANATNIQQCSIETCNQAVELQPPVTVCNSPCQSICNSPCRSPSCHSPCGSPCQSPSFIEMQQPQQCNYSRRQSLDDSPQVRRISLYYTI